MLTTVCIDYFLFITNNKFCYAPKCIVETINRDIFTDYLRFVEGGADTNCENYRRCTITCLFNNVTLNFVKF